MADEAKRVRVLTIGSANMDMVLRMKRVPAAGETIVDREGGLSYIPGGKGANCAVAAAKMGAISQFCARLGADANGKCLYDTYVEAGVDICVEARRRLPAIRDALRGDA